LKREIVTVIEGQHGKLLTYTKQFPIISGTHSISRDDTPTDRVSYALTKKPPMQPPNRMKSFDFQPYLVGELIEVRPLKPEDWTDLLSVASDPLIWEQHPAADRYKENVFQEFFREALESGGALVVINKQTEQIIGSSRFFGFDAEKSEVEIGWTFLARRYWGGKYNGELKRLMLDHAFRFVDSVVFLIGVDNLRSQKAVEKIGGVLIERRDKMIRGQAIEQVVYEIRRNRSNAQTY
jgi:N-acetyltransferase